ncbi:MAG: dephospho-CoA kinase [Desulfobacterales bacterium]
MEKTKDEKAGPVKLGITGGVGSGKSFVCNYLKEKGMRVVSADELARNAVLPCTPAYLKILDYFGPEVLSPR